MSIKKVLNFYIQNNNRKYKSKQLIILNKKRLIAYSLSLSEILSDIWSTTLLREPKWNNGYLNGT